MLSKRRVFHIHTREFIALNERFVSWAYSGSKLMSWKASFLLDPVEETFAPLGSVVVFCLVEKRRLSWRGMKILLIMKRHKRRQKWVTGKFLCGTKSHPANFSMNNAEPEGLPLIYSTSLRSLTLYRFSIFAEMNENISETAGQIKETVVETVNGMKESIGDVINEGMTKIPLKDTMENTNHLLEENLENLKNEMLNKTQSIGDETDKIADELIKDTEDVIRDAETGIVDMKNSALDMMNEFNLPSPSHSIETIQTSAPEPEIEKLLNGDENMESPEATVDELENLNKESEESPSAPEESESKPEDEEAPTMKQEDELVVEDIKDEWVVISCSFTHLRVV